MDSYVAPVSVPPVSVTISPSIHYFILLTYFTVLFSIIILVWIWWWLFVGLGLEVVISVMVVVGGRTVGLDIDE